MGPHFRHTSFPIWRSCRQTTWPSYDGAFKYASLTIGLYSSVTSAGLPVPLKAGMMATRRQITFGIATAVCITAASTPLIDTLDHLHKCLECDSMPAISLLDTNDSKAGPRHPLASVGAQVQPVNLNVPFYTVESANMSLTDLSAAQAVEMLCARDITAVGQHVMSQPWHCLPRTAFISHSRALTLVGMVQVQYASALLAKASEYECLNVWSQIDAARVRAGMRALSVLGSQCCFICLRPV